MSFETGTSTGPHDILAKIRAFAIGDLWTINRYNTTSATNHELCISKGDMYYNMSSFENHDGVRINGELSDDVYAILLNGSDAYSTGANYDRQPGYPQFTTASATDQRHVQIWGQGSYPSYMLSSPTADCIYLEVEVTPTIYQRMGFGRLVDGQGNAGGFGDTSALGNGRFFYATGAGLVSPPNILAQDTNTENGSFSLEYMPFRAASFSDNESGTYTMQGSFVRVNSDNFNGWAASTRTAISSATGGVANGSSGDILWNASLDPLSGQGLTVPIKVAFSVGDQNLKPIGIIPGLRYINISLYEPGQQFSLGSDVWRTYPWWQKGGKSGQRGLCYLRVD